MDEVAKQEAPVGGSAEAQAVGTLPLATLGLCLLALAFSAAGWTSLGRDAFVIDRRAFWGEPWRFFAAPLAHEYVAQLLAGLAGLWYFGREAERRIGTGRMLGFCGLLALVTGFAEQAFDHGGTGITSIVYGLWALLVVGGLRSPALRGAVPLGLSLLLIAAFPICVLALPVSNWGHAAGALLGAIAGLCLDARGQFRQAIVPLGACALALLGAGATIWRTSWNFGGASVEYDLSGLAALERGDEPLAESELRKALKFDDRDGQAWWNLGMVLARTGRDEDAAEACWNAYEIMHLDKEQTAYLETLLRWAVGQHLGTDAERATPDFKPSPKEAAKAFPLAARVSRLAPDDLEVWEIVRELASDLDKQEWYDLAERECARLSPPIPSQSK